MAGPTNCKRHVSGGKHKATEGKSVSPPSKKKVILGGKTSYQGKVATKSPVKEISKMKHNLSKATDSAMSPETFKLQH